MKARDMQKRLEHAEIKLQKAEMALSEIMSIIKESLPTPKPNKFTVFSKKAP
jgi:hypothetical protein